ncbi:RidA family protein [Cellulomonas sp. NPDC057328]|uniref:RidA family protein n=1 Tax=Cellulomonas sp. NPDC057328 TaxID=3346101 RepID=UPI00363BDA9A
MPVSLSNPDGLAPVDVYRHVSVATGSRTVSVAGQVALDGEGRLVGAGDLAAQTEQCYLNVATALASVGATFDDVTRLRVYAVDLTPERMPLFVEGVARAAARLGVTPAAPLTGIGVQALADPAFLVEVEATAVLA